MNSKNDKEMKNGWISVKRLWPSGAVEVATNFGRKVYFGYSKRDAERKYRQDVDLVGEKMRRVEF